MGRGDLVVLFPDGPWAASLPRERSAAVGALRHAAPITACEQGELAWLRGTSMSHELVLALRSIPDARIYHLAADGQLTPLGARVPVGRLPSATWTPVEQWLSVKLPLAGMPGQSPSPSAKKAQYLLCSQIVLHRK